MVLSFPNNATVPDLVHCKKKAEKGGVQRVCPLFRSLLASGQASLLRVSIAEGTQLSDFDFECTNERRILG